MAANPPVAAVNSAPSIDITQGIVVVQVQVSLASAPASNAAVIVDADGDEDRRVSQTVGVSVADA
jgi:hypothetical protein